MRIAFVTTMLIVAASALPSAAIDHLQEARKLSLSDRPRSSSLAWTSTMPAAVLPAQSPTIAGASLQVVSGSGEHATLELPATGWAAYQSGTRFQYVFKNRMAPAGPSTVKLAVLKSGGSIKLSARSSGITLDETSQGTVSIVLRIGDDVYCSTCTLPSSDEPGRYRARACPAPASCPVVCGDGIVDQSEQCDGADVAECYQQIPPGFPFPITLGCEPPGSPRQCSCCIEDTCFLGVGLTSSCCAGKACEDATGVGMVRLGRCVQVTCSTDADCGEYRCVDGACCGDLGQQCGARSCCADSGAICDFPPDSMFTFCCVGPGGPCSDGSLCCSGSCTSGACD